jgi:polyhydroxyalkanoate synthesis regulator phasin
MRKQKAQRRCNLKTYWDNSKATDDQYYETAHRAMDAMVKGGMSEDEAKKLVEALWTGGHENGQWEEAYESNCR